jgi:hypothetical protein
MTPWTSPYCHPETRSVEGSRDFDEILHFVQDDYPESS